MGWWDDIEGLLPWLTLGTGVAGDVMSGYSQYERSQQAALSQRRAQEQRNRAIAQQRLQDQRRQEIVDQMMSTMSPEAIRARQQEIYAGLIGPAEEQARKGVTRNLAERGLGGGGGYADYVVAKASEEASTATSKLSFDEAFQEMGLEGQKFAQALLNVGADPNLALELARQYESAGVSSQGQGLTGTSSALKALGLMKALGEKRKTLTQTDTSGITRGEVGGSSYSDTLRGTDEETPDWSQFETEFY